MLNGTAKSLNLRLRSRGNGHPNRHAYPAPLFRDTRGAALELHVRVGATVVFINHDAEAHEIVTDGKDAFASGAIDPHADWKHTFAKAGRYALYCDYHPYMKAMVVVE